MVNNPAPAPAGFATKIRQNPAPAGFGKSKSGTTLNNTAEDIQSIKNWGKVDSHHSDVFKAQVISTGSHVLWSKYATYSAQ